MTTRGTHGGSGSSAEQGRGPAASHANCAGGARIASFRAPDLFALAETSDEMIVAFDRDFRYTYLNPATEALIGPREKFLGRVLWEVAPHSEGTSYAEHYRRAMRERVVIEFEEYYPPRDRWNRVLCAPTDDGGLVIRARDTTAERRSELGREDALQSLRQSEERHRRLVELLPDALFVNHGDRIVLANPAMLRLVGATDEAQVVGRSPFDFFHADSHGVIRERTWRMLERDQPAPAAQERALRLDGSVVPVEVVAVPFPLDGATMIQVVLRDVTERERHARESPLRSGLLPALFETTPDAVLVKDREGRYLLVNPAGAAMTGLPAERVLGRTDLEVAHEVAGGDAARYARSENVARMVRERDLEVMASGTPVSYDVETLDDPKDGEAGGRASRLYRVTKSPFSDGSGTTAGVVVVARDMTEVRDAEARLRRELRLRDAITTSAADALFLMDAQGRVTFLNPAAESMFGWPSEEMLGRVLHDLLHHRRPDGTPYPMAECPLGEVMRNGGTVRGHEDVFFHRDGRAVPVLCSNAPLLSGGSVTGAVLVVSDISERKRAEEELAAAAARSRRVAETLQRSLLLKPAPTGFEGLEVHAHYEAASEEAQVGGDAYDFVKLDGGRLGLCLFDVTGHGTDAALFSADIKFSARNYLRESGGDPAECLRRLNGHVLDGQRLDGKPENVFVCAAVAVLDPATGELSVAAAGMEPPLVLRRDKTEVESLEEAHGPILGALPTWDGTAARDVLGAGDLLLCFTDGISEARRGKGAEFFGPEGIARALIGADPLGPLEGVAGAVVGSAKAFAGVRGDAGGLGDDVCLLLARRAD